MIAECFGMAGLSLCVPQNRRIQLARLPTLPKAGCGLEKKGVVPPAPGSVSLAEQCRRPQGLQGLFEGGGTLAEQPHGQGCSLAGMIAGQESCRLGQGCREAWA